jgi:hypothetical protein
MPALSTFLRWFVASLLILSFAGCDTGLADGPVIEAGDSEDLGDDTSADDGQDAPVDNDDDGEDNNNDEDAGNRNPGGNPGGTPPGGTPPGGTPPGGGGGSDPAPAPTGGFCSPVTGLVCGASISATTAGPGATSAIGNYSVSNWDATGPELAYAFTAQTTGTVTATMSDIESGQDLDIYIIQNNGSGCHSDNSIAYGNIAATWEATAGTTYFVVVDGYVGAVGSFVLDIACGDPAPGGSTGGTGGGPAGGGGSGGTGGTGGPPGGGSGGTGGTGGGSTTTPPPLIAESCASGADEDGDGLVDCDDSDCAAAPNCVVATCQGAANLVAGGFDSYDNEGPGSTDAVDSWDCVPNYDESGPEYVYVYTAAQNGQATVNLNIQIDELIEILLGPLDDLDLFILAASGGCNPSSCVAYGVTNGNDTVTWNVTAGSTWYIVVDGFEGDTSAYTLHLENIPFAPPPLPPEVCGSGYDEDGDGLVDCDDSDCAAAAVCQAVGTCNSAFTLGCGGTDSWSNNGTGSTNVISSYGCSTWNESGPEYTYQFTAVATGTVDVALSDMGGVDLDIFVLDGASGVCNEGNCTANGNTSASFTAVAGHTYYFVVDGYSGATGSYDISVTCN